MVAMSSMLENPIPPSPTRFWAIAVAVKAAPRTVMSARWKVWERLDGGMRRPWGVVGRDPVPTYVVVAVTGCTHRRRETSGIAEIE